VYKVPFQTAASNKALFVVCTKPNPPQLSQNVYLLYLATFPFSHIDFSAYCISRSACMLASCRRINPLCGHNPTCVSCYRPRLPRPLDMIILIIPMSTENHKSLHPSRLSCLPSPPVRTLYSAGHSHTPSIRNLVDRVLHSYRTKVNIAVQMATINVSLNVHTPTARITSFG